MLSPSLVLLFALTAAAANSPAKEGPTATATPASNEDQHEPSDITTDVPSAIFPEPCDEDEATAEEGASSPPLPSPSPSTEDPSGFQIRNERIVSFVKRYVGDGFGDSTDENSTENSTIVCSFNESTFEVVCDVIDRSGKYLLVSVSIAGVLVILVLMVFAITAMLDPEIDDNEILDYLSAPARAFVLKCVRQLIRRKQKLRISDCAVSSLHRIERSLAEGEYGEITTTTTTATTTTTTTTDNNNDDDNDEDFDDDDDDDVNYPAATDDDSTSGTPRTSGHPVEESVTPAGGKDFGADLEEVEELESTDQACSSESFGDYVMPGGSGGGGCGCGGSGGGGGNGGKRTRRLAVGGKK